MKKLLFLLLSVSLFSMDLTTEIQLKSYNFEKADDYTEVFGRINASYEKDNYSANIEYIFGDVEEKIDLAQLKIYKEELDIEIGRNRIGWGTGYNFNPIDIFNETPIGANYDPAFVKSGRDSIILTKYLTENSSVQGVYATRQNDQSEEFGFRYRKNIFDYDLDVFYIKKAEKQKNALIEESDDVFGVAFTGSIPKLEFGLWGEMAYYSDQEISSIVGGIDRYFLEKYYVNLEYHYNGFGENKKTDYDLLKLYSGELVGQNYFIPSVRYEHDEKLSLTGYFILNADDKSFSAGSTIQYFYSDNVELYIMPFYMYGDENTENKIIADISGDYGIVSTIRMVF